MVTVSESAIKKHTHESLLKRYCSGCIGVPITFFDKWSAEQFRIIGSFNANNETNNKYGYVKSCYTPIIINNKEKLWNGPIVAKKALYKRIVIQNIL